MANTKATYLIYSCKHYKILNTFYETYVPFIFKDLMMSLQSHILEFTQRLHSVEVERRELLQEVSKLQEENEKLGPEQEPLLNEGNDVAVTQQVKLECFVMKPCIVKRDLIAFVTVANPGQPSSYFLYLIRNGMSSQRL